MVNVPKQTDPTALPHLEAELYRLPDAFPDIQVVYLFGSQARGTADSASDVDVAVFVTAEGLADPLLDLRIASYLQARCRREVDVVIINRANPVLQHEVLRTGRRIRERDPAFRASHELMVFKRYLDHRHYQRKRQENSQNGQ